MNNSSMRYIDSSETEHWIDYKNDNLILLENNFELITKDDIQKYQNNECIYEYLAIPFETNDKLEKLKSYIRSHCLNVIYTNTCSYIFQKDTYEYLKSFSKVSRRYLRTCKHNNVLRMSGVPNLIYVCHTASSLSFIENL